MPAPSFTPLYAAFAAGYFLSYLYRTVNAVIAPELTSSLGISPSSLGFLTSVYFVAFAAMQLPAGMLLDRFGPRRIEPVLLVVAAAGTLVFAASDSIAGLALGRALIGAGVAVCLMAPLKAIAAWYPAERHASLSGWMMVAGGFGALAATVPVELALGVTSWRGVFVVLALATVIAAIAVAVLVPDMKAVTPHAGMRAQWTAIGSVFRHSRFWWIAPVASIQMGSFMAIQGLWSVPWLIEVEGYSREHAAEHLLDANFATLAGYVLLGVFATRALGIGIAARHLFAFGFGVSLLAFAAIVLRAPFSYAQWILYGAGTAVNVLGFTVLNSGFPRELAARVNTALNVFMFGGSFVLQWGIGIVIDACRRFGASTGTSFQVAFAIVLGLDVIAYTWFMLGWRRHRRTELVASADAVPHGAALR